jgi:hypothetical protein
MKISFPKCGPGELLTRKQAATSTISFVAIIFLAVVCGSYLLGNKWWLLTIGVLGIAGILLCLGVAVAIFFNHRKIDEAPGAPIEENVPRLTPQWDYRPRKPIRAWAVLDSPSTETSDGLSSDLFVTNDNVWFNDNSFEDAASTFVSGPLETEETITEALPQTTDSVCSGPNVEDAAV